MCARYVLVLCFLLCTLCQVKCDCNTYVNCFGDIINDFFSDALINTTILHKKGNLQSMMKKVGDDESEEVNVGKVFIEVVKTLKDVIANDSTLNADSKYEALKHINDKTSIYINAFNLNDFPASPEEDTNTEMYKSTKLLPVFVKSSQKDDKEPKVLSKLKDVKTKPVTEVNNKDSKPKNAKINKVSVNDTINNYGTLDRHFDSVNDTQKFYETLNDTMKMIESLNDTINQVNNKLYPENKTLSNTSIEFEDLMALKVIALTSNEHLETTTVTPNISKNLIQDAVPSYTSFKDVTTDNYEMLTMIFEEHTQKTNVKTDKDKNSVTMKNSILMKNRNRPNINSKGTKPASKYSKHNLTIDLQTYFKSKINEIGTNKDGIDDSVADFLDDDEPDYLLIDYLDIFKDTTAEVNTYPTTEVSDVTEIVTESASCVDNNDCDNRTEIPTKSTVGPAPLPEVYPWIVAIYIKNGASDQFEYICDGALLSDRCILTAAQCLWRVNQTVDVSEVITILGKQNLKNMRFDERIIRISQITMHPNFKVQGTDAVNDLAILHMENAVIFSDTISAARLENDEDNGEIVKAATTGWAFTGQLTPIYFEQQISDYCKKRTRGSQFCATYGQDVTVCPSYGGVFVIKMSSRWYLHGIGVGAPAQRGACFGKDAMFTSITDYAGWIRDTLKIKYV